jgi:hypothetical protein
MNQRLLPVGHSASQVEIVEDQKCNRRHYRPEYDAPAFHVTLPLCLPKKFATSTRQKVRHQVCYGLWKQNEDEHYNG